MPKPRSERMIAYNNRVSEVAKQLGVPAYKAAEIIKNNNEWPTLARKPRPANADAKARANRQIRRIAITEGAILGYREHVPKAMAIQIAHKYGIPY